MMSTTPRGAGRVSGQGGQNSARSPENFFQFAHPGFQFAHPAIYVTVAHPAHRTETDLREKASLTTNQEGPLPSPPSDLALQLGLVIHTPGQWLQEKVTSVHYHRHRSIPRLPPSGSSHSPCHTFTL